MRQRAARFDRHIRYYGVRYNIDPHLIRAVIRTESAFDPQAISKKGAKGLMQLMPGTARQVKVANPFDPEQNIAGGTRYLRSLLNTFRQDVRLALAAYNAGPTIVKKQQAVPQIPETVQYVKRVLTFYKQYKNGTA
jgi:soluble lytic murein transglycosylase-like protein